MKKFNIWTRVDVHIDEVTKYLNDQNLQPGKFHLVPFNDGNNVTIIYLAATI